MAGFNKFNTFAKDLGLGVHNLETGLLKIYLSNAAPNAATHTVKANVAEITATNGYTAGGIDTNATFSTESPAGTWHCVATVDPVTFTASGGSFGPFQYAVLYNDSPTSPADPLIGWWDYGSPISVNNGDSFSVDLQPDLFTVA